MHVNNTLASQRVGEANSTQIDGIYLEDEMLKPKYSFTTTSAIQVEHSRVKRDRMVELL